MSSEINTFLTSNISCSKKNGKVECNIRDESFGGSNEKKVVVQKVKMFGGGVNLDLAEGSVYEYSEPVKCVAYKQKGDGNLAGKEVLYCKQVSSKDKEMVQWGFDTTKFQSSDKFKAFLKKHNFTGGKVDKSSGYDKFIFKNNTGIVLTTAQDGSDSFLGYVGVDIPDNALQVWEKIRTDFIKNASYIKEEEGGDRSFI